MTKPSRQVTIVNGDCVYTFVLRKGQLWLLRIERDGKAVMGNRPIPREVRKAAYAALLTAKRRTGQGD